MKNNSNEMSTGAALLLTIGIMLFIGFIISASKPKCSTKSNSSGATTSGKKSTSSSKSTNSTTKKYNSYSSYDEGYEDVYDNDDYDWDRYWSDSDYADGVDDAMEDADW